MFLWLVGNNHLMTNNERMRHGFSSCNAYQWCPGVVEDIDHVLRGCRFASQVWQEILPRMEYQTFMAINKVSWIRLNVEGKFRSHVING